MAVRRLHPDQPEAFAFTPENLAWARETIAKYPAGKQASAVIPVLWRAQEQHHGWLPEPAIRYVADMLGMAYIRVYEVATFYTMFQLGPVGRKAHVQVCGTTPCMLRGSESLIEVCKRRIHPEPHHLSTDGDFSWEEVECLGSCANAPMVQIWKDTYEDLTPELFEKVLDGFKTGHPPKPGSQIGRRASCPVGGPMTLLGGDGRAGAAAASPAVVAAPAPAISAAPSSPPELLAGPRGGAADDLKLISGVGPALEKRMNELGFWHFDQIARWSDQDVLWFEAQLDGFKGRVGRDKWVEQAKQLMTGWRPKTDASDRPKG